MSAKFPRGGGGAGPFLARSLFVSCTPDKEGYLRIYPGIDSLSLIQGLLEAYFKINR